MIQSPSHRFQQTDLARNLHQKRPDYIKMDSFTLSVVGLVVFPAIALSGIPLRSPATTLISISHRAFVYIKYFAAKGWPSAAKVIVALVLIFEYAHPFCSSTWNNRCNQASST